MAKTAKKFTTDDAAAEVVSAFEKFMQVLAQSDAAGGVPAGKVSKKAAAEEPEDDEDDEDEEVEVPTREEVEAMGIKDLRTLAAELGIEEKKKADILAALEEFLEDEDEDDEEDEDEDDEEDEEDEDEDDEVDLTEMTLAELRKYAKSEGHTAADYKGMDKDAIIELIEGGDEDDEDDDEDEEVLDEEALNEMTHKELLGLCKELEMKVPAALKKSSAANKKKLVAHILESGDDE